MQPNLNSTLLKLALSATVLTLLSSLCRAEIGGQHTRFCEEGPAEVVINPVPLPSEVLNAVMRSKEGKLALGEARERHSKLEPATLLKGAPLQLSNSGDPFFILMGSGPLTGADNTWFWIVRQSGHRTSVLLSLHANCVSIGPKKRQGYADVGTSWSSAAVSRTEIFRFNGKHYRLWRSSWRDR